jgi:beta-lactamase class A
MQTCKYSTSSDNMDADELILTLSMQNFWQNWEKSINPTATFPCGQYSPELT